MQRTHHPNTDHPAPRHRRHRRSATATALLALTLTVAATGCGDDEPTTDPATPTTAVDRTTTTVRIDDGGIVEDGSGSDGTEPAGMCMEGSPGCDDTPGGSTTTTT